MKIENIKELEEYKELVPRPEPKQYEALKKDIEAKGVEEPIIVNPDGVILDGYTRYDIAKELDLKLMHTHTKKFDNVEEEKEYVIRKGLLRRHLNATQRAKIAKKLEEIYKALAKKKTESQSEKGTKGFQKPSGSFSKNKPMDSREQACKEAGSSTTALQNVKTIEKTIEELKEPELKQQAEQTYKDAEKGNISLTKATQAVREVKNAEDGVKTVEIKHQCMRCGEMKTVVKKISLCEDCFDAIQKTEVV